MSSHCVLAFDGETLIGFKRRNMIVKDVKKATVYSSPSAALLAVTTDQKRRPEYQFTSMPWKEALQKYSDGIDPVLALRPLIMGVTTQDRLDALMRCCREDKHQVTYADLVVVRGEDL